MPTQTLSAGRRSTDVLPATATRCYLDTCIVGGIVKENLVPGELIAVRVLLRWNKDRRISLVTSDVIQREISDIPDHLRFRHEAIYYLANASSIGPLTPLGLMGLPGMRPGSLRLRALQHLLSDVPDARHIFAAWKSGLDYVVTTDTHTILKYGEELDRHFDIVALRPSELVERIGGAPLRE